MSRSARVRAGDNKRLKDWALCRQFTAAGKVIVYRRPGKPWSLRAGTPAGIVDQYASLSAMDSRNPFASGRVGEDLPYGWVSPLAAE